MGPDCQGAGLLTKKTSEVLDHEQAGGGGFAGVLNERQPGLRERQAGVHSGQFSPTVAISAAEEADMPVQMSRVELFGDKHKATPADFISSTDREVDDPTVRFKDS